MKKYRFFILGLFFLPILLIHDHSAGWGGWLSLTEELSWQGWFTVGLFCLTFFALVKELMPPDLVMVLSAGILVMVGILTPAQFLAGFAKDILFIIAMLCIIVRTLEVNGILHIIASHLFPTAASPSLCMAWLLPPISAMSAFLNNTPIVLMMTSMVRNWALKREESPSRYLIPLSFAAILGGMCTLIGTSTNLIVDGLLRQYEPTLSISFFELGKIGLPIAIIGLIYIILLGYRFLPSRTDPTTALQEQTREFTVEMLVEEECPFVNQTIRKAWEGDLKDKHLVEIERSYQKIDSPGPEDVIRVGDRLIFVGDINQIADLHKIKGLKSTADPHFRLDPTSSHFSEVVVGTTSSLVGKTLGRVQFRKTYGASVLAVYRQGKRVEGRVRDILLQPGDTLMLLSTERWRGAEYYRNDFYYIRQDEKIVSFSPWRMAFLLSVLVAMVVAAALGVPMIIATLGAAMVYIFTKSISVREIQRSISWDILVLIGAAFGFGYGLQVTGVAKYFAQLVITISGAQPRALVGAIFIVTLCITELMTNNAAALIVFPIALQMVRLAGYDSSLAAKAVGITIAIAASSSFLTPIGYQTNTIVYGPGGYRFSDYAKIGFPLTILVAVMAIYWIPILWPLG